MSPKEKNRSIEEGKKFSDKKEGSKGNFTASYANINDSIIILGFFSLPLLLSASFFEVDPSVDNSVVNQLDLLLVHFILLI